MINDFSMDSEVFTARRSVQVPLCDNTPETEVVGDFSLPDYQPEIKRLLRIGAVPQPPDRMAGGDGMEMSGRLDYFVLYTGHDDRLYCAPLTTEYRLEATMGDAERALAASCGEPMIAVCDTVTDTPVGRVTAPRRLNIRCRVKSHVKMYGEYLTEGSDTEDATVETLMGETEVARLFLGVSDPLPLEDDIILSPRDGEWRVVCAEGQAMVTEATPGAGRVDLRGEVLFKLMLSPAENAEEFASDAAPMVAPELTVMQRKIPFSHAVPLDGVTPICAATAHAVCTDITVQMGEGQVHVDMSLISEVRAQKNENVRYVKDIYSTRREGISRYATLPTELAARALCGNFTLSDSRPLEEVGMDPAARVADVTAVAHPETLTVDTTKGRCVLSGTCHARLLLIRDGEYSGADLDLPFRYEFDDPALIRMEEGTDATLDTTFDGHITVMNCRARMDGERVGMDAELAVSLRTYRPAPMVALSEFAPGVEVTRRRGEYVICFPAPTDSVWSVAKRYHAPMAAFTAANNLPAGVAADAVESLEGAGYLIV